MVERIFVVIALVLCACGEMPCNVDGHTKGGIPLCQSDKIDLAQVQTIVNVTGRKLGVENFDQKLADNGSVIEFIDYLLDGYSGGRTDSEGYTRVFISMPCIAHTAIAHEVLHLWELAESGEFDLNHREDYFGENGLERQIEDEMILELCRDMLPGSIVP